MKKILTSLLIGLVFMIGSFANCEYLPDLSYRKQLNSEDNPVYYKYMEDYFNQLKQVFDNTKYRGNHLGGGYKYTVHRDGSISDMKIYLYENARYNNMVKSIILKNPPPFFYEGMDVDEMHFETFLGIENSQSIKIDYYPFINSFDIHITKKYK